MGRGEFFASLARLAAGSALLLPLVNGCDGRAADAGTVAASLEPPPFALTARSVETSRLSVAVTVDGQTVPVKRLGEIWVAEPFTLPEDSSRAFSLEILWSYAADGAETPIPIARASRSIGLADERDIRISEYRTDEFDFDRDGRDNFSEIDNGANPLAVDVIAPGEGQGDCRSTELPGEPAEDAAAERDIFFFGAEPFLDTRALEFDRERRVYYAVFVLGARGRVVVEHQSGLPLDSIAILYDRLPNVVGSQQSARTSVVSNLTDTADGERARVASPTLAPGLYCYALSDERASTVASGTPLSDIVLRIEFSPE